MFESALKLIEKYDRIIIHRHYNPDGDAIGSQVGLKHIILANFPKKEVYAVGDPAGRFSFMDDSTMDTVPDEYYKGALAVILDTSARSLISDGRYTAAAHTLRIDHHIFCEKIADTEITDTGYESCCGMIADFAREARLSLNEIAAKSLYTGMVTDSGRFRYDNTTAKTFALASFLMQVPFSCADIYRGLYSDDLNMVKLRAKFILKITPAKNNTAYIYTTADEVAALGVDTFTLSRGMVGTMSDIRGIDSWVNFTETKDGVLCEIRSAKYNINPIAVKYGGGGHAKASGATLPDRETAMKLLSDLENLAEEQK